MNSIRHPNIVDITDFGQTESMYFIIMEMLEGETLGARLEHDRPLDERVTVRILGQVASAVGAVNEQGIVHRDIKPENIFLTNHPDYPDFVKVLDFGVVKLMGAPPEAAHKTRPGSAIGTPAYMSPEQCLGDSRLDHRSDVYALGVVGYEMLTGGLPFEGDSLEVMMGHARGTLVPPNERQPDLSAAMNEVIVRALAKKPERPLRQHARAPAGAGGGDRPPAPARADARAGDRGAAPGACARRPPGARPCASALSISLPLPLPPLRRRRRPGPGRHRWPRPRCG